MTEKAIKNEQWTVRQLMSKIDNNDINKPRYQRKKKWDNLPKKDSTPNEQSYINFLFETENSVHAITFGQETTQKGIKFSNIDGNNRINAIKHFMDAPFELVPYYLDELFNFIHSLNLDIDTKTLLEQIFTRLSYMEIMNFKYHRYFIENGYEELYNEKLKIHRDEFEQPIDDIQEHLKVNKKERFDTNVKINVNLFEGYTTDELCKTFESINKYNSKLTETELLACRLYNKLNFTINNSTDKSEIEECIKEYYENKSNGEVLNCYRYDKTSDEMNAHDFIVGFQNLCSKKYTFITKTDIEGLSLFFKLYKTLYGGFEDTFTTENVNDFICRIRCCCDHLNNIISAIFTNKINSKLFNNACQDKITTLKKNNLFMLIAAIIGYIDKKTPDYIITKSIEKCLLYHFIIKDVQNKEHRENFINYDSIAYRAGGGFIENSVKTLLANPASICNKLNADKFNQLLNVLFHETNTPYERKLENGKNKCDKRRKLKFFEKTLMFYFYKKKIPVFMLDNDFSSEHIFPNSSEWDGELDKDRTGNLIPIIAKMNSSRGNKHISRYSRANGLTDFCEYIKDIIPSDDDYNKVITHENTKPFIYNKELYNSICEKNEHTYKNFFIKYLFAP